jgi:hypothetical protein
MPRRRGKAMIGPGLQRRIAGSRDTAGDAQCATPVAPAG